MRQSDYLRSSPINDYYTLTPTEQTISTSALKENEQYVLSVAIQNNTGHVLAWRVRTRKRSLLNYQAVSRIGCIQPWDNMPCKIVLSATDIPTAESIASSKPDRIQILGTIIDRTMEGDELEAIIHDRMKMHNKESKNFVFQESSFKCILVADDGPAASDEDAKDELPRESAIVLPSHMASSREIDYPIGSSKQVADEPVRERSPRIEAVDPGLLQPPVDDRVPPANPTSKPSVIRTQHFTSHLLPPSPGPAPPAVSAPLGNPYQTPQVVPPGFTALPVGDLRMLRQKARQHDELIKHTTTVMKDRDALQEKLRKQHTQNKQLWQKVSQLQGELRKIKEGDADPSGHGDDFSKMFFEDFPKEQLEDFKQPKAVSCTVALSGIVLALFCYALGRWR